MGPFKSFVMNNKAFRNLFCNPQKSFHTSPIWVIEAVNHSWNSTIAFTKSLHLGVICSSKCYCWVWRMVDSLYYSSRKIPEKCENSFVNYRINYQKLCYLMRQITKDLNSASVYLQYFHLFSPPPFHPFHISSQKSNPNIISSLFAPHKTNVSERDSEKLVLSHL